MSSFLSPWVAPRRNPRWLGTECRRFSQHLLARLKNASRGAMDPLLSGSDFNQLRAFVAVGEQLSFSRAAEALGVTPSALSQLLRGFEERVGVRLVNRTTRSVALTEAGATLFQRVRPAVQELGEAIGQVRRTRERVAGTVRVHSFRSAVAKYLDPILAGFGEAYPDVVLDITLDDAVVDLVAGGYDAALRIGEVIERDLIAVRLGPELRQIAVAAPSYLARYGRPEHPRDLVHHRCIRWRWPGHTAPYAWEFCEDGAWFSVTVDGPLIVNDKEMALRAARKGIGIGFPVEDTVRDDIAAGRLVPLLERWSAPFPGMFLCYPRQRQMAPALRAFIDTVRTVRDPGK
ncbi:LysR family transcriptional regulator [Polyangium sp. y55x31]|uniref:LysR family transcriptional regulator n=1 Tax=Polyangium sp. y55x31 TaxID=3042688 RepID=UPI002482A29E|nr:LysR family transcriptional regulator [Polyangium sp. y55x31]MDI1482863.1 LysR family transcriptional regulator [Polyangium sp. y55x31]